ncbi:hypothetical protein KAR91_85840 [Candidatus Pacearchaeota archaeon]|nr:hypothetical protein [Candidatus Pacearchaeota archaeon]
MKIAIDMDGTLWQHMNFFRSFMLSMQASGHQVGIMTVHSPKDRGQRYRLNVEQEVSKTLFFHKYKV